MIGGMVIGPEKRAESPLVEESLEYYVPSMGHVYRTKHKG